MDSKGERSGDADDRQATDEALLSATEGVLTLLQVLVMSLSRTGRMDMDDYTQLLLDARDELIEHGSVAETVVDRMLDMLVKEGADVLHRRRALRLVTPDGNHETEQTPPPGGQKP